MPAGIPVPITAVYAALLGLLVVLLSVVVIKLRRSLRVGIGDGGNRDLQRAIRVQGNATEYVPLFLMLLAVFELNHGSPLFLHAMGAVFFLGRMLHAWGLYGTAGASTARVIGTIATMSVLVSMAVANIWRVL